MMKVAEIQVTYKRKGDEEVKITKSKDAFELMLSNWNKNILQYQEEVKVLLLNRANIVLGIYELSKGGTAGCIVDIKMILSVALKCNAQSIILIHNHPSGNLKPSKADISITNKLKKACEIVDLVLLDHLIITKESFYSFADNNIL